MLEADGDLHIIKWWVDASYGTNPDMKSHTVTTVSLGKGAVYSTSTRQKLNTISSTEAELFWNGRRYANEHLDKIFP